MCGIRRNIQQKKSEVIQIYSELINKLYHCANEVFCNKCSYSPDCAGEKTIIREAADAIEELQMQRDEWESHAALAESFAQGWIPVTKQLPDVFKPVLVNIPGMTPHPTVQEAFREKNEMWYSNGFRYELDDVSHWMPLPQPPKEEEIS